jgi:hypothetical protein
MLHKRYEDKQKVRSGPKLFARRIVDSNAGLGHGGTVVEKESPGRTERVAKRCCPLRTPYSTESRTRHAEQRWER